jgi:mxaJ protein
MHHLASASLFAVAVALVAVADGANPPAELRVCADPNNLPFSDSKGDGFENKLADMLARDMGRTVSYAWWAQRRGFIRNTLAAGRCDVVIGVPAHYAPVETTSAYYRSSYVFVSRADQALDVVSLKDPRLRQLKVGVPLIGDDGMNAPPAHALGAQGVVGNVIGYPVFGDYRRPSPPARLIEAVEKGEVDIAAAWGPLAGYTALHSPVPLRIVAIEDTKDFAPLQFTFEIAMGVRKGDAALKAEIDSFLARRRAEIEALLDRYGVPRVVQKTTQDAAK